MFYSKSIYALNKKDRDAIVYEDSDGSLIRLTRENFPSQEEFLRFKAWSDENYHDVECECHAYSDNTLFLEGISEMAVAVASVEDSFVAEIEEQDRKAICCLLMSSIAECLTDLQRRRMWMVWMAFPPMQLPKERAPLNRIYPDHFWRPKRKLENILKNRVSRTRFCRDR